MGFWVGGQAQAGDEEVGCGDEGGVVVPAGPGAAFEVVEAEAVFEFSVVVFDAPADLMLIGLMGGPAGAAFALLIWVLPSVVALFVDPGQTGWNLFFLRIAALTGVHYGLVIGALVSGVTVLVYFLARATGMSNLVWAACAAAAAGAAVCCTFLLISPFWPSLLNPWVISAVLAPIAGIAFGAAAWAGPSRKAGQ